MRATLLTLAPTFPTLTSPCDPAVKPGFLSWGCPKIALPSFKPRSPTPDDLIAASPRRLGASSRWGRQSPPACRPRGFSPPRRFSSSTLRPYFRPLPILGFTAFPPVAKQDSPRCTCRPSKPSLRRQRRERGSLLPPVGPRHRLDRCRPPRSPRTLPPRPFPSALPLKPGPRGLAPSSGPLPAQPFPATRARCSLGLGRFARLHGPS